jgi:hypothetical protein
MPTGGLGKFIAGAFVRSGGEVRLKAYSGQGGGIQSAIMRG